MFKSLIYALEHITAHRMIVEQVIILLHNIGDLCGSQAVRQDLCLSFYLLHEVRVLVHNFANFALQIRPDFLLVLDDVFSFVKLGLQIIYLLFELFHLITLLLFEVCKHLFKDQNLCLIIFTLLV